MATIVLSAAGMALGGAMGGTVMGLGMATIGRAAGAAVGRAIDQRIMGSGSEVVETGRVDRFRLTGASEGSAIPRLFGRMRVSGQVIWATEFLETTNTTTTGGGKGGPPTPKVTQTSYSYSVSLAIALCDGEISRVGRVWADGSEIAREDLNMRVYPGSLTQLPDPKMEAVEGVGQVPAYRGTAYVVLEDLQLEAFGNRVPQFSFEVMRPGQADNDVHDDLASAVQGIALVPGTGEYALATTPVTLDKGFGLTESANVNTPTGQTDFVTSMDALTEELPQCGSVCMVVSWFGDDLRAGSCSLKPKVEQKEADGKGMPWSVGGLSRAAAETVPLDEGRPLYGGTPADAAVVEGLQDMTRRGLKPVFYPFILMEQIDGNSLINPWTGDEGQPALPWRGRITTSLAPGVTGTPQGTATADAEVADFFGTASVSDFQVSGSTVTYTGPDEWSYRRFILHYAHLCAAAGGVDAFCIGSEMRGLTQIQGATGFPAVAAMVQLTRDVRSILGSSVKIGYASDWSEYFGYQPGNGDRFFNLDPLWADDDIDFIGIDNYMPLSDWRDGEDHLDAQDWSSIYDLDYLASNIEGGEGFDWYYHSPEAAEAQIRTPITDGEGEPWIWRYKDLRGWWNNEHHERVGGVRQSSPTDWQPGSKPIWFTEIGCAAIDKGTNQPNKFIDLKSSESALPRASNGIRDDFIQMQYIRSFARHYGNPVLNPTSPVTGIRMVDPSRIHVWAWDARPFPAFPGNAALWTDSVNYSRGHWLNGRAGSRSLASVVAEICEASGVTQYDVSELYGVVRGYTIDDVTSARSALQPLMVAYGFDAIERDGRLVFRTRGTRLDAEIVRDQFVYEDGDEGAIELSREPAAEVAGRVRMGFVESDADYEVRTSEASFPDDRLMTTSGSELPLVLTSAEAQRVAERWLSEARVARDAARFSLPPSLMQIGPGDVVRLPDGQGDGLFRIDRSDETYGQALEAVRIEPAIYEPQDVTEKLINLRSFNPPVPVELMLMDLPLLRGDEDPVAPYVAAAGVPWPGSVALYSSADADAGYTVNSILPTSSVIGLTETVLSRAPAGRFDDGLALRVKLIRGTLSSVGDSQLLGGANLAVIGDGTPENWEVIQFGQADLVAENTYDLTRRLRGQAGSDGSMPNAWPEGSIFVLLNGTPEQIELAPANRGVSQHYRYGPSQRPLSDPSYQQRSDAIRGLGLRPYSVAHLRAGTDGSDHLVNWIRRSRLGGDNWDNAEVPLSEASERYAVRVFKDGAEVRSVTVDASNWTYTAAMDAADGPATQTWVEVAQLSEVFGEGPARRIQLGV